MTIDIGYVIITVLGIKPLNRERKTAMSQFEIYYRDLNRNAQERYLEFQHVQSIRELNVDLAPLSILEYEENGYENE